MLGKSLYQVKHKELISYTVKLLNLPIWVRCLWPLTTIYREFNVKIMLVGTNFIIWNDSCFYSFLLFFSYYGKKNDSTYWLV